MNCLIIDRIEDSGHSWGKVEVSLLNKLGITDKITPYSYWGGSYAYLEEDCDLSLLYHTAVEAGYDVRFNRVWVEDFSDYCVENGIR